MSECRAGRGRKGLKERVGKEEKLADVLSHHHLGL